MPPIKIILPLIGIGMLFIMSMQEELFYLSSRFTFALEASPEDQIPIWSEPPEEPLEFDPAGEATPASIENDENEDKLSVPAPEDIYGEHARIKPPRKSLPIITEIEPSTNSNRTMSSLWGTCTNETLAKEEKITFGIHVIMSFYKGSYKKDRFQELLMALRRNLKNPYVTAVHTLWEDRDPIIYVNSSVLEKKLVRVKFGVQPTYKDFFDYANLRLGRGAVGIVTNSDIYFDETVQCVTPVTPDRPAYNATKQHLVYALSRHPSNPCIGRSDYCESYTGSHDAFVFALPLPPKFSSRLDFTQNHIGAENVVIWEFRHLPGYVVRNPCQAVRCYHVHCTNARHYSMGTISRGKNRIGPIDRHGSVMPSKLKCGQVIY